MHVGVFVVWQIEVDMGRRNRYATLSHVSGFHCVTGFTKLHFFWKCTFYTSMESHNIWHILFVPIWRVSPYMLHFGRYIDIAYRDRIYSNGIRMSFGRESTAGRFQRKARWSQLKGLNYQRATLPMFWTATNTLRSRTQTEIKVEMKKPQGSQMLS